MSIELNIFKTDEQRQAIAEQIATRFGLSHIRLSEDFNGSKGGFWLSAENGESASDGYPLFEYYAEEHLGKYQFGVHNEFVEYVEELGYWPEWNDPGTLMLWED